MLPAFPLISCRKFSILVKRRSFVTRWLTSVSLGDSVKYVFIKSVTVSYSFSPYTWPTRTSLDYRFSLLRSHVLFTTTPFGLGTERGGEGGEGEGGEGEKKGANKNDLFFFFQRFFRRPYRFAFVSLRLIRYFRRVCDHRPAPAPPYHVRRLLSRQYVRRSLRPRQVGILPFPSFRVQISSVQKNWT